MQDKIKAIHKDITVSLSSCVGLEDVEGLRVRFLGKKGEVTSLLKGLRDVSAEDRPKVGALINNLKAEISLKIEDKRHSIELDFLSDKMKDEKVDVTLPGLRSGFGRKHPLNKTLHAILDIFKSMGFSVAEGPEVETEHYNFDALNIPDYHPARDMQDTFFLKAESCFALTRHPLRFA